MIGDGAKSRSGSARFVVVVLAVALIVVTGWVPSRVLAFPNAGSGCSDSSLTWHFDDNEDWTVNNKSWVRSAINTVDDALDYDGTKLVTVTESATGTISVGLNDVPLSQQYGYSYCPPFLPSFG